MSMWTSRCAKQSSEWILTRRWTWRTSVGPTTGPDATSCAPACASIPHQEHLPLSEMTSNPNPRSCLLRVKISFKQLGQTIWSCQAPLLNILQISSPPWASIDLITNCRVVRWTKANTPWTQRDHGWKKHSAAQTPLSNFNPTMQSKRSIGSIVHPLEYPFQPTSYLNDPTICRQWHLNGWQHCIKV